MISIDIKKIQGNAIRQVLKLENTAMPNTRSFSITTGPYFHLATDGDITIHVPL